MQEKWTKYDNKGHRRVEKEHDHVAHQTKGKNDLYLDHGHVLNLEWDTAV